MCPSFTAFHFTMAFQGNVVISYAIFMLAMDVLLLSRLILWKPIAYLFNTLFHINKTGRWRSSDQCKSYFHDCPSLPQNSLYYLLYNIIYVYRDIPNTSRLTLLYVECPRKSSANPNIFTKFSYFQG